jgi:hypothetical protein
MLLMEPSRVRVATCRDTAEAALVRSLLDGHGIAAVVAGEHHASMLGGLAGPAIALDVWVDRGDAERAAALIASLRDEGEIEPVGEEEEDADEVAGPHWELELRKRTGAAVLLALVLTFGTAHLYAGAWGWAIGLAAIELIGLTRLDDDRALGAAMVAAAILVDLIGAVIRVRRAVRAAQMPRAWRIT